MLYVCDVFFSANVVEYVMLLKTRNVLRCYKDIDMLVAHALQHFMLKAATTTTAAAAAAKVALLVHIIIYCCSCAI